jgi:hypothetical protein
MDKLSSRFKTYMWPSAVGNHYFLQWSEPNRSKTFLDKVTTSDIAYTILVYENTKEVWEEDLQIKASYKTDEERCNATHHKKTSIMWERESISKGLAIVRHTITECITKNWSGSSRNSSQVMYGIHFKIIGNCIKRNIMPEMTTVEESREPKEECEASDKDDWWIEMPDGDDIDDIEEACVDDDSPPPRNRQRLSG